MYFITQFAVGIFRIYDYVCLFACEIFVMHEIVILEKLIATEKSLS